MLSANGWNTLTAESSLLRPWIIGPVTLTLRSGPAGFLLAHYSLWFHEEIERLDLEQMLYDDHGYSGRYIGGTDVPSNHWSATAVDLNAWRHRHGEPTLASFTPEQATRIRKRIATKYPGLIWGGDWKSVDSMHMELDDIKRFTKPKVRELALSLVDTAVGSRLIKAQPKPVTWRNW